MYPKIDDKSSHEALKRKRMFPQYPKVAKSDHANALCLQFHEDSRKFDWKGA